MSHRRNEKSGVSLPAFSAPPVGAGRKDVGKINLRWASETKPRHAALTRAPGSGGRQPFEIPFQIGIIDLGEFAAFERIGTSLDLRAEDFQLEAVFSAALLEYT
jgi:hypothetical protein